jgi:hypothetical protein
MIILLLYAFFLANGGWRMGGGESAGSIEKSTGARNRVGMGMSYRPPRLHRLAESILWNRFLGSLKVLKYCLCILQLLENSPKEATDMVRTQRTCFVLI